MHGSQVQMGGTGNTQTVTQIAGPNLKELGTFLEGLVGSLDKLGLGSEDRRTVEADIAAMQAQVGASKPKSASWFRETLGAVKDALAKQLTSVIAGAAGAYAQAELPKLVDQAQQLLNRMGS